jgi:hypothetical protein
MFFQPAKLTMNSRNTSINPGQTSLLASAGLLPSNPNAAPGSQNAPINGALPQQTVTHHQHSGPISAALPPQATIQTPGLQRNGRFTVVQGHTATGTHAQGHSPVITHSSPLHAPQPSPPQHPQPSPESNQRRGNSRSPRVSSQTPIRFIHSILRVWPTEKANAHMPEW